MLQRFVYGGRFFRTRCIFFLTLFLKSQILFAVTAVSNCLFGCFLQSKELSSSLSSPRSAGRQKKVKFAMNLNKCQGMTKCSWYTAYPETYTKLSVIALHLANYLTFRDLNEYR